MIKSMVFIAGLLMSQLGSADDLLGLPPLLIPKDNPQSSEKIALGKLLFHDARFSADGTVSCASCHSEEKAFTDNLPVAVGFKAQTGSRNAPTVLNAAYFTSFFHDGRAASLEQQALGPFTNPIEHGLPDHQFIVDIVRSDPAYVGQFNKVFGVQAQAIDINHVVKAIASYERSLIAGNTAFDQYYFGRNRTAISESAARGLRLFRRKGNCANCHEISWNNALFTDNRFYNIGVGFKSIEAVLDDLLQALSKGDSAYLDSLSAEQKSALGRFNVTGHVQDLGKFKTPGLRNITLTAPYMHDGSMSSLEEVIDYYDQGGEKNTYLDAAIFPLHLTTQEKQDLLAFLQTLTRQSNYSK